MTVTQWAAAFCLIMTAIQLLSTTVARFRCPERTTPLPPPPDAPAISIVRTVCGVESHSELTLGSVYGLDYPHYEVLYCCARADDPILPLIRRLIAANPRVPSRILIGDDHINGNPKLNNVAKGWHGAAHQWIVMADSNVLMPVDYLQRLLASWRPNTGLVCSTPAGSRPIGFWAEVECGFLNTLQARWQYAAEAIGLGFAQGKTMLWRRDILDEAGGIRALGVELAEDAASTKLVRRRGLRVHLVDTPFEQPLGRRRMAEVWARQVRWARLRRVTFPIFFLPEILTGCVPSTLAGAYAASMTGYNPFLVGALLVVTWMASEVQLALSTGWRLTYWSPLAWVVRDLMIPCMVISAWVGDDFVWRGNEMNVAEPSRATPER